jgi:Zn-dependent membrane protease YugP
MSLYLVLFLGTLAISLFAQARVKSLYHRYSQISSSSHATGAEVAQAILQRAGIGDVEIVAQEGILGDHYDPLHKRLVLSTENYQSDSLAAIGVAAHECGHALQHQQGYGPLHLRMAAVGAVQFANQIIMILPLLFMFTHFISVYTGLTLMAVGWGVIMLFNLVTLPVEFDASNRAKLVLAEMGFTRSEEEATGVRKVLDAAGWTYVAAFITSLAYMLYYLLPLLTGGRSRD